MDSPELLVSRPLLILQRAPYSGSSARAAIDMAMSFAVFAQEPQILFAGDGILALLEHQDPESLGRKSLRKVVDSLPLYDIERVFYESADLERFGLNPVQLPEFAQGLSTDELRSLQDTASCVVSL